MIEPGGLRTDVQTYQIALGWAHVMIWNQGRGLVSKTIHTEFHILDGTLIADTWRFATVWEED
jgi:hypothetical protein